MKAAIITAAGISSRFNERVSENDKCLKAIYYEKNRTNTLLYHLLDKCMFADKVILVGGYQYHELEEYCEVLPNPMKDKIVLIYNEHYADLASGYSLYVGLNEIFDRFEEIESILFVEGDLDIDRDSFCKVIGTRSNVLTYSFEPIYAEKAVVLYQDGDGRFKYIFNSSHGLLEMNEAFSMILNSGQIWKFTEIERLKAANKKFYEAQKEGTNLCIIQNYVDSCDTKSFELISLLRWTNCNTREDYRKILAYWKEEEP